MVKRKALHYTGTNGTHGNRDYTIAGVDNMDTFIKVASVFDELKSEYPNLEMRYDSEKRTVVVGNPSRYELPDLITSALKENGLPPQVRLRE